jgi:rhodanese-related sulfurtransferase
MIVKRLVVLLVGFMLVISAFASHAAQAPEPQNPKKKTTLQKYIIAVDAYESWKATPEKVKILDVRTPEEYFFVGHAPMARNIPLLFWTGKWNQEGKKYDLKRNPDFEEQVKKYYKPTDTVMVMCRTGERAAEAVNAMAKLGFTDVYNIVDSFDGDLITDPDSYYIGKRMKNGWRNSGSPWTYDIDTTLIYAPEEQKAK